MCAAPLEFRLIPVGKIPPPVRVITPVPVKFVLVPVTLPEIPAYAGRRHEVLLARMDELGFRTLREYELYLAHEERTFYDELKDSVATRM